jgi:hypothetical protein
MEMSSARSDLSASARWPAAVLVLLVAGVHVPVTPEHLVQAPYIGVLFIALIVVCVGLAPLLAWRDSKPVWAAAGVVNALAIGAYAVSRSLPLPQIGDDVGNWTEPLGMAAVVAESVTVLVAAAVLWHRVPRTSALWLAVGATVLFTAGCSTAQAAGMGAHHRGDAHTHVMTDGSSMADSEMSEDDSAHVESGDHVAEHSTTGSAQAPSEAAAMICTDETRDAVVRTFDLAQPPASTDDWSSADRVYSCTYDLPAGDLDLTVQDGTDQVSGTTYFAEARARFDKASAIGGIESFGFPAFETENGNVVFLKDGKTLRVDASSLRASELPAGFSRPELAYSVAAAIIACWTE